MVCKVCGGSITGSGVHKYACTTRVECGPTACTNDQRFHRDYAEHALVASLRNELANGAATKLFVDEVRIAMGEERAKRAPHLATLRAELRDTERKIGNLVEAITTGGMRSVPALGKKLHDLEARRTELETAVAAGRDETGATNVVDLAAGAANVAPERPCGAAAGPRIAPGVDGADYRRAHA